MSLPATPTPIVKPTKPNELILEAWGQGLMVGSLVVMAAVTFANMKRHILLHKLIFAELILAMPHGTFIFPNAPAYGWYLSVTAIGLNVSWSLHNVIAWMKNRPFLSRRVSRIYIVTVLLVQPYWVLEIYANFTFFNNINQIFTTTRPMEPIFRDPWWVFTTISLFYTIKREYNFGIMELVVVSPRFGIMLASMCLSIAFILVDTCAVLGAFGLGLPTGVEPFWKLSFIFKCLCDTVILDDFKTALDRMRTYWLQKRARDGEILLPATSARGRGLRGLDGGVNTGDDSEDQERRQKRNETVILGPGLGRESERDNDIEAAVRGHANGHDRGTELTVFKSGSEPRVYLREDVASG